ncbi:MAG: hypothetical protein P8Z68_03825 [Kineosporiaceae bacterium]|jgi:hypothetical protein
MDEHLGDPQGALLQQAVEGNPLDWATVEHLLRTAASPEHFSHYVRMLSAYQGLEEHLAALVTHDPTNSLYRLLLGARTSRWAWDARGDGTSDTVPVEAWAVWFGRLGQAEDLLNELVANEPGNAEAWRWLITIGYARQVPDAECWRRYEHLVDADPLHYYGHQQMLEALKAKWGGSHEAMFDFARSRAASAPGTNLPVLIAEAHYELTNYVDRDEYLEQPEVGEELVRAVKQSVWHPDYQETLLSWEVRNLFAYLLACADRDEEAARLFEEIGDTHMTRVPWDLDFRDPGDAFVSIRQSVRA